MNATRQRGMAMVETAIVALVALVVMFAVLEIGRAFFAINALEEATRRGARVAAVCQVNDPAIARITIFNDTGVAGPSPLIHNLTSANVQVSYLNDGGGVVGDPVGSFLDIGYVRVAIVNYQHQLLIPMFLQSISLPGFATTLPRESLGVSRDGFTTC
jgi:hypothetical protein